MRFDESNRTRLSVDMSGGLITRLDPGYLGGVHYRELKNVYRGSGSLTYRNGWTKLHTTGMPWSYCCGGFCYKQRDGTIINLVVGDDGKVYKGLGSAMPAAVIDGSGLAWSADNLVSFAQWRDDAYMVFGTTSGCSFNLRYDGGLDLVVAAGLAAPAGPTVAAGAAGNITGDVLYKIVFAEMQGGVVYRRSPGGNASTLLTLVAQKAELTGIPCCTTADGGGSKTIYREIYRYTTADGAYKLLTTLVDNTTLVYTDNLAAAALTGGTVLPTTNENIPVSKIVVNQGDGVLFWLGDVLNNLPADIHWSYDVDTPEGESATNAYLTCGEHGDAIIGGYPWSNGVLVGKEQSHYYLDAQQKVAHRICGVGLAAQNSYVTIQQGRQVAFLSPEGPMVLVGQEPRFVGTDPRAYDLMGSPGWEDVELSKLSVGHVYHIRDQNLIVWQVQTDAAHNYAELGLAWDYNSGLCWTMEGPFTQQAWEWRVAGSQERRAIGAFNGGFIGRMNVAGTPPTDGAGGNYKGTVIAATASTITLDRNDLPTDGDGLKGVPLFICGGTGSTDGSRPIVIDSNDASSITLSSPSPVLLDTSTTVWPGGFEVVWDIDGITAGDAGVASEFQEADIHLG